MQTLGIYAKQEYINSDLDDSAVCRERSAWVGRTSKAAAAEANGAHQSVRPLNVDHVRALLTGHLKKCREKQSDIEIVCTGRF